MSNAGPSMGGSRRAYVAGFMLTALAALAVGDGYQHGAGRIRIRPIEILLPDGPMHCTAKGQVGLLEGGKSIFDINAAAEEQLVEEHRRFWRDATDREAQARAREVSGIRSSLWPSANQGRIASV